jgi:hypothetical protein
MCTRANGTIFMRRNPAGIDTMERMSGTHRPTSTAARCTSVKPLFSTSEV